jgi:circadian clock protein KaiB
MTKRSETDSTPEFEAALRDAATQPYVLTLFVSGITPNSARAIRNIQRFCDKWLAGRYSLTIVDLYQEPERARAEQIVAAPTLVRKAPPPAKRIVGDMQKAERILLPIDLPYTA